MEIQGKTLAPNVNVHSSSQILKTNIECSEIGKGR
jgi:hypothetical protein